MKSKQFIQRLQRRGVHVDKERGKGGHYRLDYQDLWTTLTVHGSKDLSPAYLKKVCKQLGIDSDEIL